jgi:transposase
MEPVSRKVVYRLYPSRSQEEALLDMLGLHQRLYNAALEQRIAAWRLQRKSLSGYDQMRDLTDLRADDERYAALNAQSAQVTLNRLHLQHVCSCGLVLSRDQNAARVILLWALARTGREPTGCLAQSA